MKWISDACVKILNREEQVLEKFANLKKKFEKKIFPDFFCYKLHKLARAGRYWAVEKFFLAQKHRLNAS